MPMPDFGSPAQPSAWPAAAREESATPGWWCQSEAGAAAPTAAQSSPDNDDDFLEVQASREGQVMAFLRGSIAQQATPRVRLGHGGAAAPAAPGHPAALGGRLPAPLESPMQSEVPLTRGQSAMLRVAVEAAGGADDVEAVLGVCLDQHAEALYGHYIAEAEGVLASVSQRLGGRPEAGAVLEREAAALEAAVHAGVAEQQASFVEEVLPALQGVLAGVRQVDDI